MPNIEWLSKVELAKRLSELDKLAYAGEKADPAELGKLDFAERYYYESVAGIYAQWANCRIDVDTARRKKADVQEGFEAFLLKLRCMSTMENRLREVQLRGVSANDPICRGCKFYAYISGVKLDNFKTIGEERAVQ